MLYLLFGKDTYRSRQKLNELLDFFRSKTKDFGIFRISGESFNAEEFESFLKSKNLFNERSIIVCIDIVENKSASNFILNNLERCADSENIFLFLEKEVGNDILALFKKSAEKIQKFDLLSGAKLKKWIQEEAGKRKIKLSLDTQDKITEKYSSDLWRVSSEIDISALGGEIKRAETKEQYNPFQICDAFAYKDRKTAWILFQKALFNGITAEEVFWKIWWQIKTLILVKNQPHGLNLHPFVIKKTLRNINNFTKEELNNLSWQLVNLYHKTRKGQAEFEIGLEKFILNI
ncbi:hypothetical protein KKB71_00115 [Patescibacteria group bacterium]|nr:hypothetical protein [Patescibacteria group bacterium]MBU2219000.1 hypothetical protein [Patescibacteria group bacterium]MBU2263075.1 hypothetical protein [Patescibacteria group bacterium]